MSFGCPRLTSIGCVPHVTGVIKMEGMDTTRLCLDLLGGKNELLFACKHSKPHSIPNYKLQDSVWLWVFYRREEWDRLEFFVHFLPTVSLIDVIWCRNFKRISSCIDTLLLFPLTFSRFWRLRQRTHSTIPSACCLNPTLSPTFSFSLRTWLCGMVYIQATAAPLSTINNLGLLRGEFTWAEHSCY